MCVRVLDTSLVYIDQLEISLPVLYGDIVFIAVRIILQPRLLLDRSVLLVRPVPVKRGTLPRNETRNKGASLPNEPEKNRVAAVKPDR